jgi:hypothetical protein
MNDGPTNLDEIDLSRYGQWDGDTFHFHPPLKLPGGPLAQINVAKMRPDSPISRHDVIAMLITGRTTAVGPDGSP